MTDMNFETPSTDKSSKRAPRYVTISAWAAPVMVLTGWALLASVPVALILFGAWRDGRIRALRWWAAILAGLYAIPFVGYLTRSDMEASMSDLLHPAMGLTIAAAAVVILVKIHKSHRG